MEILKNFNKVKMFTYHSSPMGDKSFQCINVILSSNQKEAWRATRIPFMVKRCLFNAVSDSKFSKKTSMKEQMDSIHEGKKPFKCNICDSSFTRNHSLKTHIASVHEGNKPFQCSTCGAGFARNSKLKVHITSVHEGKNRCECSGCDAFFYMITEFENTHCISSWRKEAISMQHLWC